MYNLIDIIEKIGSISLQEFWFPIFIWTIFGGLALLLLNLKKDINPLYQYHLRIATVLALPAGIILSKVVLALYTATVGIGASAPLIFIQNPLTVDLIVQPGVAPAIDFTSPNLWLGVLTLLVALTALFLLFKLGVNLIQLSQIKKSLSLVLLNKVEGLDRTNMEILSRSQSDVYISFSDHFPTPFTFGWNTPVIVVPESIENDHEALNMIVCHELIHIRRKDYHLHVLVTFLKSIFNFHPLFHYAARQIKDFREISCDQEVITEIQASPKKYAELIFSLMQTPDHIGQLQVSLAHNNSNLKQRISTMKYHKLYKSSYKKSILFIALLSVTIMLPIACTEMTSDVELDEKELAEMDLSFIERDFGFTPLGIDPENITFTLDGKPAENAILEKMNPDDIKSIRVIKLDEGKRRVELYTKANEFEFSAELVEKRDLENSFAYRSKMDPSKIAEKYGPDVFAVVEKMPEAVGGLTSIMNRVNYPVEARRQGIEGRVTVQFVVNESGDVENPQIIRGIGGGADEEALRVIRETKFEPGIQRGRAVSVLYTLPIVFKLEGKEQSGSSSAEVDGTYNNWKQN